MGMPKLPKPCRSKWPVLENRVPFGILFIRVPYYVGDLKGDPSLENYPNCSTAAESPVASCPYLSVAVCASSHLADCRLMLWVLLEYSELCVAHCIGKFRTGTGLSQFC